MLPETKTATKADKDRISKALTLAFVQDPTMRWIYPETYSFATLFPELCMLMGAKAFEHESALYVDDYCGAALWLPPGVEIDEEPIGAHIEANFKPEKQDQLGSILEQMDAYHPHDEPCWYLAFLGVDINFQGQGLGAFLMKDVVQRCDENGTLAYLESSNPTNVSFYERYGFEVMGQISCGNPVPIQPMIRTPRTS